jgi:hypothetical protein
VAKGTCNYNSVQPFNFIDETRASVSAVAPPKAVTYYSARAEMPALSRGYLTPLPSSPETAAMIWSGYGK